MGLWAMCMPESDGTTTIEVKHETWAALDRRKDRGDSFDDVIQKLINTTPAKMGSLQVGEIDVENGCIEELTVQEREEVESGCSHYDVVTGDSCNKQIEFRQSYRYPEEDEWSYFYYCEEHAPEGQE